MATKKPAKKAARKPNAAFMKPMRPDDVLAEVVETNPFQELKSQKNCGPTSRKTACRTQKTREISMPMISLRLFSAGRKP